MSFKPGRADTLDPDGVRALTHPLREEFLHHRVLHAHQEKAEFW